MARASHTTGQMRAIWLICLLTVACGDTTPVGDSDGGVDAGLPAPDAGPDLSDELYDPGRVLEIEIDMDPADWDLLRRETRSFFDVLGSSCLTAPPESPFNWYPASVTIDGERLDGIAVRKKGFFGSLDDVKPSLKLDLDELVAGQQYLGRDNLTLNNDKADPSHVKQCLGYQLFRAAGVPAPRCNFAVVTVNGERLGVYSNVEAIKPAFLRRHFGTEDGNLYEGALSDFRPGWVETFQKKTNETDPDRSDLEALVPILEGPDADLVAELEAVVDLDAFITFWAMELIVMHADGYARNTNNFYLYDDPATGRFHFIPWGIDAIMFSDVPLPWENGMAPPTTVWAEGVLAHRLYAIPATRDAYLARLQELLDAVWIEEDLLAELDRMEALLTPHVPLLELDEFHTTLDGVRDFVADRRAELEGALAGGPEDWSKPLRDPWCIEPIGTIDQTFTAAFEGLEGPGIDPFGDGDSSTTLDVPQLAVMALDGGAISGYDADSGNPAVVTASWLEVGSRALIVQVIVDAQRWESGAVVPIDWASATAVVATITWPAGGGDPVIEILGMIGDGTIELDQAGATVSGRIASSVYEPIF